MAAETFTNEAFHYPARFPRGDGWMICEEATREYEENDIIKGPKVRKGSKICNAVLALSDEIDEDASPTATMTLRLNNGTTQVSLVTLSTTQTGTANGVVQYLNAPAGINHLVEDDGYWVEAIVDAAVANPKTAIVTLGVQVSTNLWGGEQATVES